VTFDARTLSVLLRAGDARAVKHVRAAMKATGGAIRPAAERLGVSVRALHGWLELPALRGVPRLGRAGAAARAQKCAQKSRSA